MLQLTDNKQLIGYALVWSTALWALVLVVAPAAAPHAAGPVGLVYLAGSMICHQQPERSFHLAGAQLPVCARCLGLYLGAACGVAGWAWANRRRAVFWSRRHALVTLCVSAVPTAVTAAAAATAGVADPSNVWRWLLALPLGVTGGLVAGAGASDHLK